MTLLKKVFLNEILFQMYEKHPEISMHLTPHIVTVKACSSGDLLVSLKSLLVWNLVCFQGIILAAIRANKVNTSHLQDEKCLTDVCKRLYEYSVYEIVHNW